MLRVVTETYQQDRRVRAHRTPCIWQTAAVFDALLKLLIVVQHGFDQIKLL